MTLYTMMAQLLEKDSYGYEMNKSVQEITDKSFELKEATSFRRLETSGDIASYWGDENTGARRRYYSITNKGRQLFEENVKDWQKAKAMIDILLKTKA